MLTLYFQLMRHPDKDVVSCLQTDDDRIHWLWPLNLVSSTDDWHRIELVLVLNRAAITRNDVMIND